MSSNLLGEKQMATTNYNKTRKKKSNNIAGAGKDVRKKKKKAS